MKDLIIYNLATCPERQHLLGDMIESIYEQADIINIALNRYDHIPKELDGRRKIHVMLDTKDVWAERGKFASVSRVNGYYFGVDDDIIYPDDYSRKMIEAIERYGRRVIVCVHGNIAKTPFTSFYKDCEKFLFHSSLLKDTAVHFPGTGTIAFHTDTIKLLIDQFKCPYMSDIWMGILTQEKRVPVIAIRRETGWLKPVFITGIYEKVEKSPQLREQQNSLIRRFLGIQFQGRYWRVW